MIFLRQVIRDQVLHLNLSIKSNKSRVFHSYLLAVPKISNHYGIKNLNLRGHLPLSVKPQVTLLKPFENKLLAQEKEKTLHEQLFIHWFLRLITCLCKQTMN